MAFGFITGKKASATTGSPVYRQQVKRQFFKRKRAVFSLYILYLLLFVFVFADFMANDKPLIASYEGKVMMPVVKEYFVETGLSQWPTALQHVNWKELDYDWAIWPPVPYAPGGHDVGSINQAPFAASGEKGFFHRHWLGTDALGRDLLSGMVHATRIDLSIGIIAMGVAAFIGILFGSLAGFFGDDKIRTSRIRLLLNILFFCLAIFYAFIARKYSLQDGMAQGFFPLVGQALITIGIFWISLLLANLLSWPMERAGILAKQVPLPLDITISRLIEVVVSIPVIFLIIMVLAIVETGSVFWVMVVIGLTRWTGIARFIRAELLRIRQLEYVESAYALGFPEWRVLLRHAIPNSMAPVFVAIAFGIASSILIEAFLAFVGLGVPPDVPSWGGLLNQGRQNPSDWWMALFPGLAIFLTVTVFNLIGEGLADALDPKQKE